jgi:amino acid adenylation domain-containing protein
MSRDVLIPVDKFEKEKRYWLNKLSGELSEINLSTDFPRKKDHGTANHKLLFAKEITQHLIRISKNNDLSLFVLLLTSFKILLFKYTRQNEIIVSSPTYSISKQEYNRNVLFRDFIYPEMTFKEVLLEVKQTVGEGYKNQYFSIRRLIDLLDVEDTLSLFRIIVLFENIHDRESVDEIKTDFENDMTLCFRRTGEELDVNVTYNSRLFKKETVQRLIAGFQHILLQISANTNIAVTDIETITGEEADEILYEFNKTGEAYPEDQTIHRLFAGQVERTPDHTAVVDMETGVAVTYRQLNERANQLARVLTERAVDTGCIVGLMMHDSAEMAVAVLGVLKAGGAYLPIDPDYPRERRAYMIEDSRLKMLLVGSSFSDRMPGTLSPPSMIPLTDETLAGRDTVNLQRAGSASDIAYVIYTSGTTGRPKGVVVEHKGLINFTSWRLKFHRFNEKDVTLQLFSPCFDGFGSNFYPSLLSGGTLLAVPASRKLDYDYIKEIVKHKGVTNATLVPGMYEALLDIAEGDELESIRFVVLAGERTGSHVLEKALEKNPRVIHINEYGPTETTVGATANANMNRENTAVIGKPISNTRVYILDPYLKIVPRGVSGELYIGGAGVARGYLNRPELTAEKFIDLAAKAREETRSLPPTHPLTHSPYSPIYRTGDLARWLADGNIEFLGRIDHQVKVRGYRIELGEIENQLLQYGGIKEAVVITRNAPAERGFRSRDHYLCCYIVSDETFAAVELREFLSGELPDYMIPSYFVQLEKIPLTPGGKVDRQALPAPESGEQFTPPRNEIEEKLAGIWSEVLGIEKGDIGIDHNFFELGGHSLRATVQAAKIHKVFNVKVPLEEIFKLTTIRRLSDYIKEAEEEKFLSVETVENKEYYPLSPGQKRFYILQQIEPAGISYNMPMIFVLNGVLDREKMENSFKGLIKRHESLRTSFQIVENNPVQRIYKYEEIEFELAYDQAAEEEAKELVQDFINPFDMGQPPLLKVEFIRLEEEKHLMMVDMHHILSDGVSQQILVKDFMTLYRGKQLSPLRLQYKDFSQWQSNKILSGEMKKQEEYWLKQYEGEIPELEIPTDYPRPQIKSFEGALMGFEITGGQVETLREFAKKEDITMFVVMLTIFYILLFKLSSQEDIVVGTVVSGREHLDLDDIIGIFINTLALRNYPGGHKTFIRFLREVKVRTLEAFGNQDYQFEDLVENVLKERNPSRNPLFDVVFSFSGSHPQPTEASHQEQAKRENRVNGEDRAIALNIGPYLEQEGKTAKFDIVWLGNDTGDRLVFSIEYCTKLFKKETVERFAGYFEEILLQAAKNETIQLKDITISTRLEAADSDAYHDDQGDFGF